MRAKAKSKERDNADVIAWLERKPERPSEDDFPDAFDVDRIYEKLFQGAWPPKGEVVASLGFDVLVLCAKEFQPPAEDFPGVKLVYMPSDDYNHIPPTAKHLEQVQRTAEEIVEYLRQGKAVLVTCHAGFNRSGLVTGTVLHLWHGWSGEKCVDWVKRHREDALCNKRFAIHLKSLRARD